jgi:hypothetical protein
MKIVFSQSYRFASNGFDFDEYEAGMEYEVSRSCADSALQSGVAVLADEPVTKPLPVSPRRAVKPAGGNKG